MSWVTRRLERFQAKWTPVRVKKTRQIKNLEPRFDSIETETALGYSAYRSAAASQPRHDQAGAGNSPSAGERRSNCDSLTQFHLSSPFAEIVLRQLGARTKCFDATASGGP